METNHTKGEWMHVDGSIYSEQSKGADIATINTTSGHFTDKEAEANGNLIAAAPDLLEALMEVRYYANAFDECPPKMKDCIINAIKKATT